MSHRYCIFTYFTYVITYVTETLIALDDRDGITSREAAQCKWGCWDNCRGFRPKNAEDKAIWECSICFRRFHAGCAPKMENPILVNAEPVHAMCTVGQEIRDEDWCEDCVDSYEGRLKERIVCEQHRACPHERRVANK